mgnify:FL=1
MMTVMLVILAATVSLYLRIDQFHHLASRHLWAEDGNVFLNDASSGWATLWRPYAGYIHLYPRLIALISQCVELINRPNILLCGWLISYALLVHAIARLMRSVGASPIHTAAAVALVSLQPQNGEVLFNITNSQWMMGAALFTIAITPQQGTERTTPLWLGVVVLMGLTGPFSIILAPIIILYLWHRPTWRGNRSLYAVIVATSVIQAWVLLSSGRATQPGTIAPFSEWLATLTRQLTLGAGKPITYVAAFLFLSLSSYLLLKTPKDSPARQTSVVAMMSFLAIALASAYASKEAPILTSPLSSGSRYNWIPYTLIILYGIVISARSDKKTRLLLMAAVSLISMKATKATIVEELQFESYARFSEIKPVIIPINPVWNMYPGWHISARPSTAIQSKADIDTDFPASLLRKDLIPTSSSTVEDKMVLIKSESGIENSVFDIGDQCRKHLSVGLEIDLQRDNDGFVTLRWSESEGFPEQNSLKRWYPKGAITAQFAFQRGHQSRFLQITPMDSQGTSIINSIRIYCLN